MSEKCPTCGKQQSAVRKLITHVTEDVPLCIFCRSPLNEPRLAQRRQGERRDNPPSSVNHRADSERFWEFGRRTGRDRRTEDRRKA